MNIELPSTGEGGSSAGVTRTREDIDREGCEIQCSWRKVATDQGVDASGFTFERCEEVRAGLDLKGLARCGMAGISISIVARDGFLS